MRLDSLSPAHTAMLMHYLAYWRANQEVLLDGQFRPEGINAQYDLVRAVTANKQIVAAYADRAIVLDAAAPAIDLVNATASTRLVVDATQDLGRYEARAIDAEGREVSRTPLDLTRGAHVVAVPRAGIVALVRRP
jgi:alpha-galactosidase